METKFEDLLGKTLTAINVNESKDEMEFVCSDGTTYLMYHSQDCCESVNIDDIDGELETKNTDTHYPL